MDNQRDNTRRTGINPGTTGINRGTGARSKSSMVRLKTSRGPSLSAGSPSFISQDLLPSSQEATTPWEGHLVPSQQNDLGCLNDFSEMNLTPSPMAPLASTPLALSPVPPSPLFPTPLTEPPISPGGSEFSEDIDIYKYILGDKLGSKVSGELRSELGGEFLGEMLGDLGNVFGGELNPSDERDQGRATNHRETRGSQYSYEGLQGNQGLLDNHEELQYAQGFQSHEPLDYQGLQYSQGQNPEPHWQQWNQASFYNPESSLHQVLPEETQLSQYSLDTQLNHVLPEYSQLSQYDNLTPLRDQATLSYNQGPESNQVAVSNQWNQANMNHEDPQLNQDSQFNNSSQLNQCSRLCQDLQCNHGTRLTQATQLNQGSQLTTNQWNCGTQLNLHSITPSVPTLSPPSLSSIDTEWSPTLQDTQTDRQSGESDQAAKNRAREIIYRILRSGEMAPNNLQSGVHPQDPLPGVSQDLRKLMCPEGSSRKGYTHTDGRRYGLEGDEQVERRREQNNAASRRRDRKKKTTQRELLQLEKEMEQRNVSLETYRHILQILKLKLSPKN